MEIPEWPYVWGAIMTWSKHVIIAIESLRHLLAGTLWFALILLFSRQLSNLPKTNLICAGLKLVKVENDRLTHIVTLATSIMKAGLCFVVLGQKDKMVLAKQCGIDEEDDVWLPSACAWSLKQDPGLLVISNMTVDERWASHTDPHSTKSVYKQKSSRPFSP